MGFFVKRVHAASVAVVAVVAVGGHFLLRQDQTMEGGVLVPSAAYAQTVSNDATDAGNDVDAATALKAQGYAVGDVGLGAADAPVEVIEYLSMTCPYCASYHADTLPLVKEKYIDSGKIHYVVREIFPDSAGFFAAVMARCAGPEQYHAYLDVLFQRQDEWARSSSREELMEHLSLIGRLGGLSNQRIEACMSDTAFMEHLFETARANAAAAKVPATPYFVVNGQEGGRGALDIDDFSAMVDPVLDE